MVGVFGVPLTRNVVNFFENYENSQATKPIVGSTRDN